MSNIEYTRFTYFEEKKTDGNRLASTQRLFQYGRE